MLSNVRPLSLDISKRAYDKKFSVWGKFISPEYNLEDMNKFVQFGEGTVPARLVTIESQIAVFETFGEAQNYVTQNTKSKKQA